ncbi:GH25 family lysozyme [Streptomyces sp. H39-S7]|uniref:GH25 family lysozyme n=1 Tax=Streptomyces sp. H39-S7 TaxID=3004357 RepID=UPI0022AE933E|nr:GH25 family lysozyme [Streptomyces sp. H39-S7]MCZ4119048.1 GH25 family lysozyme [Streptomyces sp. H39-S7]
MTIKGIDVSNYQAATWSTTGLDFVFIKATEGHTLTDSRMTAHAQRARAAGLQVGFYHFLWPGNIQAQAEYFTSKAASVAGDILAVDWETNSSGTHASNAEKDQFLKAVKKLRPTHKVILYTNTSDWKSRDKTNFVQDGLWIAQYNGHAGHPDIKAPWLFHQYDDKPLDEDVAAFSSRAALKSWATALVHPATPPTYEPFPGANWFTTGRKSPIVLAMRKRLIAVGCNRYKSNANPDVIGDGDKASYEAWQRKCGFTGKSAEWPPGKATWDKLQVPNV